MTNLPFVSIIVPCYNEEATIRHLLDSILGQTYPLEKMELIISDGLSEDHTREVIIEFQKEHPVLHLAILDNRVKTIPAGLNQAIRESRGEIIIRLDAHSVPIPEYVERCVYAHLRGVGDNIGGVWEIRPGSDSWVAESISLAAAHPLGVGDAMYRIGAEAGPVDTVPFGSFRRSLIDKIGGFDETLLVNEDYEFNTRIREADGVVWLDPSIRSVYFSRSTFSKLAFQYWRYGYWKFKMLKRYPHTMRLRQGLPPLFVLSLIVLVVLSLWIVSARYLLALQLVFYIVVLFIAALEPSLQKHKIYLSWGIPLAITTMHITWGSGFLYSGISNLFSKNG